MLLPLVFLKIPLSKIILKTIISNKSFVSE